MLGMTRLCSKLARGKQESWAVTLVTWQISDPGRNCLFPWWCDVRNNISQQLHYLSSGTPETQHKKFPHFITLDGLSATLTKDSSLTVADCKDNGNLLLFFTFILKIFKSMLLNHTSCFILTVIPPMTLCLYYFLLLSRLVTSFSPRESPGMCHLFIYLHPGENSDTH